MLPFDFYKNIAALYRRIGAAFQEFNMPFVVHSTMSGTSRFFTCFSPLPGGDSRGEMLPSLRDFFQEDLRKWDQMMSFVRAVNFATT
jgi:hypothetical protein